MHCLEAIAEELGLLRASINAWVYVCNKFSDVEKLRFVCFEVVRGKLPRVKLLFPKISLFNMNDV